MFAPDMHAHSIRVVEQWGGILLMHRIVSRSIWRFREFSSSGGNSRKLYDGTQTFPHERSILRIVEDRLIGYRSLDSG